MVEKRWFDRMVLSAPMIDLPGRRTSFPARRALLRMCCGSPAWAERLRFPAASGALTGTDSFINNPP